MRQWRGAIIDRIEPPAPVDWERTMEKGCDRDRATWRRRAAIRLPTMLEVEAMVLAVLMFAAFLAATLPLL